MTEDRKRARELAAQAMSRGRPLDWFEELYRGAEGDHVAIPWADMVVNPNLAAWLEREAVEGAGRPALVVGCGLGDDAEALASRGFQVSAFDLSSTCIDWCRQRFPSSTVSYSAHDLFRPSDEWKKRFDFVFEAYTLQVLPSELRQGAMRAIAECVAPSGTLLVVTRGRAPLDNPGQMPWPLLHDELAEFTNVGLTEMNFKDYVEHEDPPVRRFRVEYRRAQA